MSQTTSDLRRLGGSPGPASTVAAPPFRWKTRLLLPGLLVLAVVVLLGIVSASTLLPATPVRVVPVVVKTVEGRAGSVTVQAPGWLEPDPHPQYVTALADGVVEGILVLAGDRVERGQVVARLVADDARLALARAEAELLGSRARLRAAEAEREAARLELEHLVDRGQAVAIGEATVGAARAEIERAQADAAVERARLLEIEDELERKSKLTRTQAVSEATVARLRLRADAQQATVDATRARVAVLEAKLREAEADRGAATTRMNLLIEERRAVALADADVAAAEAAVALARAHRDEAALRLDRMSVRAPADGIVMRRLAAPGSRLVLGAGEHAAHVAHLYDPARLQVRVDVPLADAGHVLVGQSAEITVEVLPDHTFSGTVSRIVHEADIQKNTVEAKVAVDEPSPELKPEMLARVRFLAREATPDGTVRQRVFAPRTLVQEVDGQTTALVVGDLVDRRGRVERRMVTTGSRRLDGWIEIESGLRVGDLLVADPGPDLEPGDRVAVVGEQTARTEE